MFFLLARVLDCTFPIHTYLLHHHIVERLEPYWNVDDRYDILKISTAYVEYPFHNILLLLLYTIRTPSSIKTPIDLPASGILDS